jgi:hypothetical protein
MVRPLARALPSHGGAVRPDCHDCGRGGHGVGLSTPGGSVKLCQILLLKDYYTIFRAAIYTSATRHGLGGVPKPANLRPITARTRHHTAAVPQQQKN